MNERLTLRSGGPAGWQLVPPSACGGGPVNFDVRQRMERSARSNFLDMRASARFGSACKLRDAGKKEEALKVAREALAILGHPHVIRFNPAEGAVLSCATVLVEELAGELEVSGANLRDIVDTLRYIRAVGPEGEFVSWIPYLEQRAAQGAPDAA